MLRSNSCFSGSPSAIPACTEQCEESEEKNPTQVIFQTQDEQKDTDTHACTHTHARTHFTLPDIHVCGK